MKKRKSGRILSRETSVRKALMLSIARALILREKIQTTEAKAKEVSPFVEKLVTKAKKGDLASRRELLKSLQPRLAKKMLEEIGPRYRERNGGYTRIFKLERRKSDGAKMAIVELVK
jgi:large subunit ribosomal protein L17